jgi:hypothetical protein
MARDGTLEAAKYTDMRPDTVAFMARPSIKRSAEGNDRAMAPETSWRLSLWDRGGPDPGQGRGSWASKSQVLLYDAPEPGRYLPERDKGQTGSE